jgi:nucleotide-binding universal stress UspA family protein
MSGIVVGVDGSDQSQRALEWAMAEAALRDALLTVVTVRQVATDAWGTSPMVYSGKAKDVPEATCQREMAQEMADKAMATLGNSRKPKVTIKASAGVPADELIRASEDADMEVVGSRGSGGFARLCLGSVSTQLVHHAHCPVVVIRA